MAKTFSNGMDEVKIFVDSSKSDWKHKEIAQQKDEVSDTKTCEQVIEDVVHRPTIRLEKFSFASFTSTFYTEPQDSICCREFQLLQ